jgi:hypothetical protein
MGHPSDAAAALQQFTGAQATFFSGVASWIAGDDDRDQWDVDPLEQPAGTGAS